MESSHTSDQLAGTTMTMICNDVELEGEADVVWVPAEQPVAE